MANQSMGAGGANLAMMVNRLLIVARAICTTL
jgi:hypothetical protein